MSIFRYSLWDGSQDFFDLNADKLMDELRHKLMSYGDLSYILHQMQRDGLKDSQGRRLPGIEELRQRLRQRRQSQLDKYDLSSVMEQIRQSLAKIVGTEREGIERTVAEARQKAKEGAGELSSAERQRLLQTIEAMAAKNLNELSELPQDVGGQIKGLSQYEFMDEAARRQFQELVEMLKKHALETYSRDLVEKLKGMDANSLAGIRHLAEALNQMLEQRLRGEEPDFAKFMEEFGSYFGAQPPQNLDELMERLQSQMAQAQSLLESLSPEDRQALDSLLRSMLDDATRYELAKLAANLEVLSPSDKFRERYSFSGEEPLSYTEALKLMEMLQRLDKLEAQLKDSQYNRSLEHIDEQLMKGLLGEEAAAELERLKSIPQMLEEAGYIRRKDNRYELTPRGMRKIGQKALEDIFAQLRKDRLGEHKLSLRGNSGERIDETKRYEFGDDFQFDLQRTIMNSIYREPKTPPVQLDAEDFEVYRTEGLTRSATVLMLDLSLSMPMRGNFEAAKRVTLALDGLIRTQYPRDSLYIVGFSSYARQIRKEDLSSMTWDEFDPYTNMQHGFRLARKLLSKEKCTNKQIIMISDGEPTAHFEGGTIFFQYPPTLRTLHLTLKEVMNCTKSGVVVNTFMLESGRFLGDFVVQMARINKGRVFFTSADRLGQYLLVDYISSKRKRI